MDAETLLVTLDTGLLDDRDRSNLDALLAALPDNVDVATVSVSGRERGVRGIVPEIPESIVLDESTIGEAVWASEEDVRIYEGALTIIGSGSFPPSGERHEMTPPRWRQLRDASLFDTHVRGRRHLLITKDKRGFVSHGKRERLEALGSTTIRTPDEIHEIASRLDAAEAFAAMRQSR